LINLDGVSNFQKFKNAGIGKSSEPSQPPIATMKQNEKKMITVKQTYSRT